MQSFQYNIVSTLCLLPCCCHCSRNALQTSPCGHLFIPSIVDHQELVGMGMNKSKLFISAAKTALKCD